MPRALALAASAIVLLASCGGGSKQSDDDAIRDVVRQSLTGSDDVADCHERLSDNVIRLTYGTRERCVSIQRSDKTKPADSVEFTSLAVHGDRANTQILIGGGDADGAKGGLGLVREEGDWRIDSLSLELLRSLVGKRLTLSGSSAQDLPPNAVDCVRGDLRSLPDSDFRHIAYELIGETDEAKRYTVRAFAGCEAPNGQSVLRALFEQGIVQSLRQRGATEAQVRCALRGIRRRLADEELPALLSQPDANAVLGRRIAPALQACG